MHVLFVLFHDQPVCRFLTSQAAGTKGHLR